MTATLGRRGMLLPEVRDHLRALGIPRELQRALLETIAEPSVVDLVLGDRSAPRLRS